MSLSEKTVFVREGSKLWVVLVMKETFLVIFDWIACGSSNIFSNICGDFVGIQNERICTVELACITNPHIFKRDSSCIQRYTFCSISKSPIIIFITVQIATYSTYLVNEGRCDSDTCVTRIVNFSRLKQSRSAGKKK